jgi:hypothetical protein
MAGFITGSLHPYFTLLLFWKSEIDAQILRGSEELEGRKGQSFGCCLYLWMKAFVAAAGHEAGA